MCTWRGPAVDLVLDRSRHNRSQFVFTTVRRRPAIFWQTPSVTRRARPRLRLPAHKGAQMLTIEVDAREQRPYRFADSSVTTTRAILFAGDYAVSGEHGVVAAVERKTIDDLVKSITSGALGFAMADLSSLATAAVVVEDRFSALLRYPRVNSSALLDVLVRLQVRYPSVPIVFTETRKLAEHWTHRFLAAAKAEYGQV
jgi:ERCC4-type nuclease